MSECSADFCRQMFFGCHASEGSCRWQVLQVLLEVGLCSFLLFFHARKRRLPAPQCGTDARRLNICTPVSLRRMTIHAEGFCQADNVCGESPPGEQCVWRSSDGQIKRTAGRYRTDKPRWHTSRCARGVVQMKTEKENTGEHPSSGSSYYAREGFYVTDKRIRSYLLL
ncbi:hypothetical protein SAMN05660368_01736 [Marvinbryantia formatexigens]|nr:hypothetical protein SAMN05660368_01736 [Marvinbryantia formatexigens]